MSEFTIDVIAGKPVRLPTAGKYCDRDIVIRAFPRLYSQELAYIENTSLSHIDTGFKPNHNTSIDMTFEATVAPTYDWPFGARENTTVKAFGVNFSDATNEMHWTYGNAATKAPAVVANKKIRLTNNKAALTVTFEDGTSSTATCPDAEFESPCSLMLFNISLNGKASAAGIVGRIYSCKIYDNGTLARDFIPVLDNYGVPCLYDKVEDKLYYNAGTGKFTYGFIEPEVV